MPHLIVEYSSNLENKVDMQTLCDVLRDAAVETGVFPLAGIRVRALKCEHYTIADSSMDAGFIDISVRLRGGRSLDARKNASELIFAAAESHLNALFTEMPFALSFEMRDIDPELSPKRTSIRDFMNPEN